ncbi:MAG: hypothetical protein L6R28_22405 [Planctomycetes bacterium]|nr:hypothetical protein [Planctomycetota bacterium]
MKTFFAIALVGTLPWFGLNAQIPLAFAGEAGSQKAPTFSPNPKLTAIPEKTAIVISDGYKGAENVLDYSGMTYDRLRHRILAFGGGHAFYYSPGENKWHKVDEPIGFKVNFHHHVYDSVNNVHVTVSKKWDTYAFKLSDEPGKLPGTRAPGSTPGNK